MSSHSRPVHESRRSASQRTPHGGSRRGLFYILASIVVAVLFVVAAESQARQIEYLREFGVAVDGTIGEMTVAQFGGRHPSYWIAGTYPAISPAGRDVVLTFRYNVTKAEYDSYTEGDTLPLIYDPESYSVPLRAANYAQTRSDEIRMLTAAGVVVFALITVVLAAAEGRRQARQSAAESRLRRAFGSR